MAIKNTTKTRLLQEVGFLRYLILSELWNVEVSNRP